MAAAVYNSGFGDAANPTGYKLTRLLLPRANSQNVGRAEGSSQKVVFAHLDTPHRSLFVAPVVCNNADRAGTAQYGGRRSARCLPVGLELGAGSGWY
jgi:hypothetical protein